MSQSDRLKQSRIDAGFASARAACDRFGWTYSTYVSLENGTRDLTAKNAPFYAKSLQVSPEWLLYGRGVKSRVPVLGYIGAGAEVFSVDDHAKGGALDWVDAPPGESADLVALRVKGDSMWPAYGDGDVIYYSKHTPDLAAAHKRDCVVRMADGRTLLKRVEVNSSGVLLISHNAPPTQVDRIEWAAPVMWLAKA
jgi:phage repressor protein C with HTH and peptisase S24 domain